MATQKMREGNSPAAIGENELQGVNIFALLNFGCGAFLLTFPRYCVWRHHFIRSYSEQQIRRRISMFKLDLVTWRKGDPWALQQLKWRLPLDNVSYILLAASVVWAALFGL